jgi:anti-sigma B factor antagonist
MPGIRSPLMINGVPVVAAPAEIDVTTAEQLRSVLLRAAVRGQATIVVDMSRTRFCDSAGLTVLVRAHRRAVADGGELRAVLPAGGAVARIFALTCLDRVIPVFASLDEALAPRPGAVIRPLRPPSGRRRAPQPDRQVPGRTRYARLTQQADSRLMPSGPMLKRRMAGSWSLALVLMTATDRLMARWSRS